MIKVLLTYVDFEGKEKTRDFYFNLTKSEIRKIDTSLDGGVEGLIERIKDDDTWTNVDVLFEKLILSSYGKRSATGAFLKNREYSEEFAASDAYSELLLKFYKNEDDFVMKFLNGVLNISPQEAMKLQQEQTKLTEEITSELIS